MSVTKDVITQALKTVIDPASGQDVITSGLVSAIIIREGMIGFSLEATAEPLRKACEQAVKSLPGVNRVTVVLTAHNPAPKPKERTRTSVERVKHIIAVASGKGGVGKSTTAVNLAIALGQQGVRTGLLDADIYGPSIPHMMGIRQKPEIKDNKMIPVQAHGVFCISMGMLVDENRAIAWRGSMVSKALFQLFRGTIWPDIEVLIVDMPPGTGDIHLSLAENYPVSGAIVVSTPQEIALIDAKRAVDLFAKVHIPVIGMVENMSYFQIPGSENRSYIFGKNGVKNLAKSLNINIIEEVPLEEAIRQGGDNATPIMAQISQKSAIKAYSNLATQVIRQLR